MNRNHAPWPEALESLVDRITYRPGWTFRLADIDRGQDSRGLTLDIITQGMDAYHPERGENYRVHHYFIVPAASYNEASWLRWVFDQVVLVETHECMEWFQTDGVRPYAALHGPGHNPYVIREIASDEDRRTSFRGVVKE